MRVAFGAGKTVAPPGRGPDVKDPTDRNHGLDLKAMATRFAEVYKEEKSQSKESGLEGPRALPGVHHPIFKGKPVNYDPIPFPCRLSSGVWQSVDTGSRIEATVIGWRVP
jgi:hypothetical protein